MDIQGDRSKHKIETEINQVSTSFSSQPSTTTSKWAKLLKAQDQQKQEKQDSNKQIYRFIADLPHASADQQVMRDLFNVHKKASLVAQQKQSAIRIVRGNKRFNIQPKPELELTYKERSELLNKRLIATDLIDKSFIYKDISNPMTIPRIEAALNQIDDYLILTEGAKPHSQFTRSQIALKFLDVCEKPNKYNYLNRYSQDQAAGASVDKHIKNFQELEQIQNERAKHDMKVIQLAMKCQKISKDQVFPDQQRQEPISIKDKLAQIWRKKEQQRISTENNQSRNFVEDVSLSCEEDLNLEISKFPDVVSGQKTSASQRALINSDLKQVNQNENRSSMPNLKNTSSLNLGFTSSNMPSTASRIYKLPQSDISSVQNAVVNESLQQATLSMYSSRREIKTLKQIEGIKDHKLRIQRSLEKLQQDVETKVLESISHNVDASKRPQKGQTAFEHMIKPAKILQTERSMEKHAEISDHYWKNRSSELLNVSEKVNILKKMEKTRLRRMQHQK